MTKEEFNNIYYTGTDAHAKQAIEEMNKEYTLTDISKMLGMVPNTFRNHAARLGVKANKKVFRKIQEKKWRKA